jgi:hypothetical protein
MILDKGNCAEAYTLDKDMGIANMPATKPLPGFLIPPEDREVVNAFLSTLFNIKIDGSPFHEHCSRLRPMPFDKK